MKVKSKLKAGAGKYGLQIDGTDPGYVGIGP
jgi:hypothetical protein